DNHVLPWWRGKDLKSITRRDVVELLDKVADAGKENPRHGGPIAANRTLAAVRKLFNWALARGVIEASPVVRIDRPGQEQARDRILRPDEIVTLWRGAER